MTQNNNDPLADPNTLSVSELVGLIKSTLEGEIGSVTLTAEISSFKSWRSGHWYFDLKDEQAGIPSVMFKHTNAKVPFQPEDGQQVLIRGKVSIYAAQSRVQLIVTSMEPIGQGGLMLAFEQLKKRLETEGLFSPGAKKQLPIFPKTIGIATSPQGAVLRDMVRIFKQRMPGINLLLAPTRVQGKGSAEEIARAVHNLDASGNCDLIIIGRGGGSLEDLWSFNEEVVARAVFACRTPTISAVGHEPDVTICDYVADKRCATPTHAASEAVLDEQDLMRELQDKLGQCGQYLDAKLHQSHLILERMNKRLKDPKSLLLEKIQRVHELSNRLSEINLDRILSRRSSAIRDLDQKMQFIMQSSIQQRKSDVIQKTARLEALSPLSVLSRGYSVISVGEQIVSSVKKLSLDDKLSVRMQDGQLSVRVESID